MTNNLWLGSVQRASVLHGFFPSYFTNTTQDGVFDPMFAFYGGPVYAVLGVVGFLLGGNMVIAQDVLTVVAIASAYGGIYWIGRTATLSVWNSHIPSVAFVSCAYYVTDLYGRGDWLEFLAISSIPLVVAGAFDRLSRGRWTVGSLLLFSGGVIVFTGAHNITLLWGSLFLATAALARLAARGALVRSWPSMCSIAAVGVLATSVNGWALLPDLLYASKTAGTLIGRATTFFFDTWPLILSPLRVVPKQSTTPALFVEAPFWFIGWSVLGGAALLLVSRRSRPLLRSWLMWTALLAAVLGLIMAKPLWSAMPRPLVFIQFPYRLSAYVAFSVAALTGTTLLMVQRENGSERSRSLAFLKVSLDLVVALSLASCVWQLWVPDTASSSAVYADRAAATTSTSDVPRSWYESLQYADRSEPIVAVPRGRELFLSPLLVRPGGSSLRAKIDIPGGTAPILTNIVAGPYLLEIGGGIERIGRSASGFAVVRRRAPGREAVDVVIQTAGSPGVLIGRSLTVGSTFLLLVMLVLVARANRKGSSDARDKCLAPATRAD